MPDLIDRLKSAAKANAAGERSLAGCLCGEAAAEIERLRAALRTARDYKVTDGSGFEVEEDSLHEIRKTARRALGAHEQ